MAQPSLSRQIQQLEKELGVQLFVRKSHRVELTPEGIELVFRPLDPQLETGSAFVWKHQRTFSEAAAIFKEAMKAELESAASATVA